MKIKIGGLFNDDEENCFKIKVEDINSEVYIKELIGFLDDLKIPNYLEVESETTPPKYKEWIGGHEFFRTKNYVMHIIFSEVRLVMREYR